MGDANPAIIADEHVGRFEVAVHEAGGMRGGEPTPGLNERVADLAPAPRAFRQPGLQRRSSDAFHREVDPAAPRASIEYGHDVRMVEPRHRLRFAQQPSLRELVAGRVRVLDPNQLERHVAVELAMPRGEHLAHAAFAERIADRVWPDRVPRSDLAQRIAGATDARRVERRRFRAAELDGRGARRGDAVRHRYVGDPKRLDGRIFVAVAQVLHRTTRSGYARSSRPSRPRPGANSSPSSAANPTTNNNGNTTEPRGAYVKTTRDCPAGTTTPRRS